MAAGVIVHQHVFFLFSERCRASDCEQRSIRPRVQWPPPSILQLTLYPRRAVALAPPTSDGERGENRLEPNAATDGFEPIWPQGEGDVEEDGEEVEEEEEGVDVEENEDIGRGEAIEGE